MSTRTAGTDSKRLVRVGPVVSVERPCRAEAPQSRRARRKFDRWLLFVVLLSVPVALYAAKNARRLIRAGEPLIRSDGIHYFVYLPSLFFDRDLDFENDYAAFGIGWTETGLLSRPTATGRVPNPWPAGTALLWAPAYLLAHPLALCLREAGFPIEADGRGVLYQLSVLMATQIYVLVGVVLLYRLLCRWFERPIAAMSVAGMSCGTFLLFYTTVDASFSHGPGFFASVLLLVLSHRHGRGPARPLVLGLSLGLLTDVRPEAALLCGFPLASLVLAHPSLAGGQRVRLLAGDLARLGLGFLLALSPQLLCWQVLYGAPWDPRANPSFFHLGYAPALAMLGSTRNGLYSWSPILLPATAGLFVLLGRDRRFALLALGTLAAEAFVLATAADWWGGAAFGARRFAPCLPLLAVGLGRAIETLVRRPRLGAGILLGLYVADNALQVEVVRGRGPGSEAVSFRKLADERYALVQREMGSPGLFPFGLFTAWSHGLPLPLVDEIWGTELHADLQDVLEFEAPAQVHYLGRGWSAPVSTAEGRSVCWVTGPEATLYVQLGVGFGRPRVYPRKMLLTLAVLSGPRHDAHDGGTGKKGARASVLEVFVNGRKTNQRRLPDRFRFLTLRLPTPSPSPWTLGLNEIRIKFSGEPAKGPESRGAPLDARATWTRRPGLDSPEARELLAGLEGAKALPRAAVDRLVFR